MLTPPFSPLKNDPKSSTPSSPPLPSISPAIYTSTQTPNVILRDIPPIAYRAGNTLALFTDNPSTYYTTSLLTPRLNTLKRYLWLAGLPSCARPLHRQLLLNRQILLTEDPNEHLIWHQTKIFLKPLPLFLLSHDCWTEILCRDQELYTAALSFLLSYAWLIRHPSDLHIAHTTHLLPREITWPIWTTFTQDFLTHIDLHHLSDISPRFHHGELRLSRLNKIYWITEFSWYAFIRGYMGISTWYQEFFTRNFAWSLAVFGLFAVALDAMQVAGTVAKGGPAFDNASYGFSVASLFVCAGVVGAVLVVWVVLFVYHVSRARLNYYRVSRERKRQ